LFNHPIIRITGILTGSLGDENNHKIPFEGVPKAKRLEGTPVFKNVKQKETVLL